jgi:hypothetical protein
MATYKYSSWSFGQVEALLNILGGDDIARKVLAGTAKVTVEILSHIVDGNADPFLLPDKSWKVESHQKSDELKITREGEDLFVNGKKIDFYLSEGQQNGNVIGGNDLRKELADKPVLNANVLDYLREYPKLIPDSWKTDANGNIRYIFFWGTIYRNSVGNLYVRCLCWVDGGWFWSRYWLDRDWDSGDPAAVLQVSA